jgi:hypothetical protein
MNERIKELWEDSDEIKVRYPEQGSPVSVSEQTLEKFAELIVRECIQVAGPEDSYTDEWFKAKVDSVQKIKQHFGVEE